MGLHERPDLFVELVGCGVIVIADQLVLDEPRVVIHLAVDRQHVVDARQKERLAGVAQHGLKHRIDEAKILLDFFLGRLPRSPLAMKHRGLLTRAHGEFVAECTWEARCVFS